MQPGCAWPHQSKTSSGQHAAAPSTERQEAWKPRHFPSHGLLPWQVATLRTAGQGLGKEDKAVQPGPVPPSGGLEKSPCSQELEHMTVPLHSALQAPWGPRAALSQSQPSDPEKPPRDSHLSCPSVTFPQGFPCTSANS